VLFLRWRLKIKNDYRFFHNSTRSIVMSKENNSQETQNSAKNYFEEGVATAKIGKYLSEFFAGCATYSLSGNLWDAALVALTVLSIVSTVCGSIIYSAASVVAHIDKVSEAASGAKPVE
jgi:hypothetical protein